MGLGGGGDGSGDYAGLHICRDLDRGSSHVSATFGNQPLCGKSLTSFGIAHVEVLQLEAYHESKEVKVSPHGARPIRLK